MCDWELYNEMQTEEFWAYVSEQEERQERERERKAKAQKNVELKK